MNVSSITTVVGIKLCCVVIARYKASASSSTAHTLGITSLVFSIVGISLGICILFYLLILYEYYD